MSYGDDFHVVAVRFDLCDRSTIGVCPRGAPGRLRLVLQPLYTSTGTTFAYDVAVHTFYTIPANELASVVVELRALARIQDAPPHRALPRVGDDERRAELRHPDGASELLESGRLRA